VLPLTVHERRLIAALRAGGWLADGDPTRAAVRAAAEAVLADFIVRWIGKQNSPCA
jgi:hypothetical protein